MFPPGQNTHAHTLAVAAATTPLVGARFDDLKWAISVIVSVFGSLVAIYLFRAHARLMAESYSRFEALERRRFAARPVVPVRKPGEPRTPDLTFLDE